LKEKVNKERRPRFGYKEKYRSKTVTAKTKKRDDYLFARKKKR
jgi:hypothetical protein